MKKFLVALLVVLAATIVVYGMADAKVTGECVNCHTMHNSQDGAPVAMANANWDGGAITGDASAEPNGHLLVTGCIGCHTATSGLTVTTGSTTIPIVRTLTDPAGTYLAGGNFYYSDNNDAKGHNISTADATLPYGPSPNTPAVPEVGGHCANSCHSTLTNPVRSGVTLEGCQGCHLTTFHHGDPGPYNATSTATDPTYRFLTGHHYFPSSHSDGNGYVEGQEDSDWEITTSATDHNWYKGWDQSAALNADDAWAETRVEHTISMFCSNCHEEFHRTDGTGSGTADPNDVLGSVWMRHPVDQAMPTVGEFAGYTYSTETPVAYSMVNGTSSTGAVVACVSCHRTHASQYDDMLRFDYSTMLAGMGGSGGCFNCHADKN
jgi:hypothetical protein